MPTWDFDVSEFPFSCIRKTVTPGGTILAAMLFQLEKKYDYVWFIEDDVLIKGDDWGALGTLDEEPYDFIGIKIEPALPSWPWLRSLRIPEYVDQSTVHPLKTLCGVSRISRAAAFVTTMLMRQGFGGHHEIVVPTIVKPLRADHGRLGDPRHG